MAKQSTPLRDRSLEVITVTERPSRFRRLAPIIAAVGLTTLLVSEARDYLPRVDWNAVTSYVTPNQTQHTVGNPYQTYPGECLSSPFHEYKGECKVPEPGLCRLGFVTCDNYNGVDEDCFIPFVPQVDYCDVRDNDCAPETNEIYPGAPEACDCVDEECDSADLVGLDNDGDGYGMYLMSEDCNDPFDAPPDCFPPFN